MPTTEKRRITRWCNVTERTRDTCNATVLTIRKIQASCDPTARTLRQHGKSCNTKARIVEERNGTA